MKVKAVRARVAGRVQRVGYRRYILDVAQELGLSGYVQNLPDGSVETLVQGEEESVTRFIDSIGKPTHPAMVRRIDIEEAKVRHEVKSFDVKHGSMEEELQEGFGAIQSIFTEYWKEFRGFANRTDQDFKLMSEKYGETSDKLTVILETMINESRDTREQLARAMAMLAEAIQLLRKA